MPESENEKWLKSNLLGLMSFAVTALTIFYFGVIKGNDQLNAIKAQGEAIVEIKVDIKALQAEKVDKETFNMIMSGQREIQSDIKDVRRMLLEHINK